MKAATLLAVLLVALAVSPQQITPVGAAPPRNHPGLQMLMLNQRDLLLAQLQAWLSGYEISQSGACQEKLPKNICDSIHIEAEQGSDSETIRFHAYYPVSDLSKQAVDADVQLFSFNMSNKAYSWLKFERRDNGGPVEPVK